MSDTTTRPTTPAEAWAELQAGNGRFVTGSLAHPNQDAARRDELASGQAPFATVFGCGDSRVAAEVIFDQGLGDLFVVRTAGHVIDAGVLGSLEFAVEVLGTPLIVVLGHDSCGAVNAAVTHAEDGTMPPGYIRDIVERVTPSVVAARLAGGGTATTDEVEAEHVRQTIGLVADRSRLISAAIEKGRCAIVGLVYDLAEGRARVVETVGAIGG